MATKTQPRIAIIGGGPGGLILLLTLHKRGIPATLYEREASFSSRAHLGGSLDLGYESGQRALRENGLEDAFNQYARPQGESLTFCDSQKVLFSKPADPNQDPLDSRPEIDRSALRKIMLDAIPADAIKWGHGLVSAVPLGDGQHELTFANGHKTVCDILVGADGANSRVRPLVSSAVPVYHGVTGAEISIAPEVATLPALKDVVELVGEGMFFACEHSRVFGAQPNGDGRIRVYAWFRAPADWVLPTEPSATRKFLLEKYEGWAPWVRTLIEHCDAEAIYQRSLYMLPLEHRWDHAPGVTLLGDAAHLMSPFAGAGANLAMLDALELGLVLVAVISGGKSVEEREAAIAAWEEVRMSEGRRVGAIAAANVEAALGPDATPQSCLATAAIMQPAMRRKA